MDFTLADNPAIILYAYPRLPAPWDGTVQAEFQLTPPTRFAPVVGVFLRYCTPPEAGVSDGTPLSNLVAAIQEIGAIP